MAKPRGSFENSSAIKALKRFFAKPSSTTKSIELTRTDTMLEHFARLQNEESDSSSSSQQHDLPEQPSLPKKDVSTATPLPEKDAHNQALDTARCNLEVVISNYLKQYYPNKIITSAWDNHLSKIESNENLPWEGGFLLHGDYIAQLKAYPLLSKATDDYRAILKQMKSRIEEKHYNRMNEERLRLEKDLSINIAQTFSGQPIQADWELHLSKVTAKEIQPWENAFLKNAEYIAQLRTKRHSALARLFEDYQSMLISLRTHLKEHAAESTNEQPARRAFKAF